MRRLVTVIGVSLFVLVMAWSQSMWVRGFVQALTWDGKSTFSCGGNLVARISGKTISLPAGAGRAKELIGPSFPSSCQNEPGGCPLFSAGGNCELEIVDCDLTAPTVIYAGGSAKIKLINTKIHGRVERGGSAIVTGLPELDKDAAAAELSRRFGQHGCDGVLSCYRDNASFGNIDGKLVVTIAASGKATDATYQGSAPQKVADCLVALGKSKRIVPFDDKPGTLSCIYTGSFTPGTQSMNTSPSFSRD